MKIPTFALLSLACCFLSGCYRSQTDVALENALIAEKALNGKLSETEAALSEAKASMKSLEAQLALVVASPEYEFWKIRTEQHTQRERLNLLQALAKKYPETDMARAAGQTQIAIANGIGDAADELLKQSKFDEATKLIKGVSDGLPQLSEFEARWLEKIQQLADYHVRFTKGQELQGRVKAGQVAVEEIIGLVRGKSPNDVIAAIGRPDSSSRSGLGQEFVYFNGALSPYTGKGERLVILFADSPVNKVLSVKAASSSVYYDEDVRRQVNAVLGGR